ncbi:MAG: hypothetical protein ACOCUL_04805, partial [Bacteroidota bacterium]
MAGYVILNKNHCKAIAENEYTLFKEINEQWHLYIFGGDYNEFSHGNIQVFIFGDMINPSDILQNDYTKLMGNFQALIIENNTLRLINSLFSILPVYYYKNNILVSNHIGKITKYVNQQITINKKYCIETALFNYPFRENTAFQEIKLLDTNSVMLFNQTVEAYNYFN